jgi:hypothetical protein
MINAVALCLLISSIFSLFVMFQEASGVEFYSKDEKPFGVSKSEWLARWWTWWITTSTDDPKKTCLMNNSTSMVMLMETTVAGNVNQVCDISSKQGIIVPAWVAFMEKSTPEVQNYSFEQLGKYARETFNLGSVTSLVKVDGVQVAKLDEVSSMSAGNLNYKINALDNITEIYSTPFNITIPENTAAPDQNTGTFPAAAHGWMSFLKPLPPGEHTIFYNVGVTGTGPNDHSAEITYNLRVK